MGFYYCLDNYTNIQGNKQILNLSEFLEPAEKIFLCFLCFVCFVCFLRSLSGAEVSADEVSADEVSGAEVSADEIR